MKNVLRSLVVFAVALVAFACAPAARAQAQPANLYAASVSAAPGETPVVTGNFLFAKQASANSAPGTYLFTAVDVIPQSTQPFAVNTNVGVGVAQRVATIAGHDIFVPTSLQLSTTGSNIGYAWFTGAATNFPLKFGDGHWGVFAMGRVEKSSVAGQDGYRPIFGIGLSYSK